MKVKIIRDCPWSYRLTTNGESVKNHLAGTDLRVPDNEGQAMVDAGYAEQCKPGRKPGFKPAEKKIVKPRATKKKKVGGK